MHPRDFVKKHGRQIAIANGYPEDTLSRFTSRETSARYTKPREAVMNHFGLLSMILEGKLILPNPQELK